MRMQALALAIAALAASGVSHRTFAQDAVTIYRCTDADGAVTVQNDRPCPQGSTQSKRVLEGVPTAPPPPTLKRIVPASAPAVPATPATPAPLASTPSALATTPPGNAVMSAAERSAPPALYECRAFDGSVTLTERSDPVERCAPLTTTGLDGSAERAAGQSCELRADICAPVGQADLCSRWQQRLRDAQAAERFGNDAGRSAAQADIARAALVLRESTCAGTP